MFKSLDSASRMKQLYLTCAELYKFESKIVGVSLVCQRCSVPFTASAKPEEFYFIPSLLNNSPRYKAALLNTIFSRLNIWLFSLLRDAKSRRCGVNKAFQQQISCSDHVIWKAAAAPRCNAVYCADGFTVLTHTLTRPGDPLTHHITQLSVLPVNLQLINNVRTTTILDSLLCV